MCCFKDTHETVNTIVYEILISNSLVFCQAYYLCFYLHLLCGNYEYNTLVYKPNYLRTVKQDIQTIYSIMYYTEL